MILCRKCMNDDDHFLIDHAIGTKAVCEKCKEEKSVVRCNCRRKGYGSEDVVAGAFGSYF